MGGGHSSTSATKHASLDQHNEYDTRSNYMNQGGWNDIHGGNVGPGASIALLNLAGIDWASNTAHKQLPKFAAEKRKIEGLTKSLEYLQEKYQIEWAVEKVLPKELLGKADRLQKKIKARELHDTRRLMDHKAERLKLK